tara:strand:+ start:1095 stop:1343 length:249 start_codon:yes stop_codon:yes gene_type:complete
MINPMIKAVHGYKVKAHNEEQYLQLERMYKDLVNELCVIKYWTNSEDLENPTMKKVVIELISEKIETLIKKHEPYKDSLIIK